MCMHTHVHMHAHALTLTSTYTPTHTHTCAYTNTSTHVYMNIEVHLCTYLNASQISTLVKLICTCKYTKYVDTYTQTHMYCIVSMFCTVKFSVHNEAAMIYVQKNILCKSNITCECLSFFNHTILQLQYLRSHFEIFIQRKPVMLV